jgi:murein DD-endopeptidase MepM/ murein hydrolase activator NlpD
MRTQRRPRGGVVIAMFACFVAGGAVGWRLHTGPPAPAIAGPTIGPAVLNAPAVASGSAAPPRVAGSRTPEAVVTKGTTGAIDDLRNRALRVPLDSFDVESFRGGFSERRESGGRPHEAVDMPAPRNTPVHAVENGTIAKLFLSKAGGNTIYQYDPSGEICYYYAHLERYADGLSEGSKVSRGDVIGFVGSSGNAPANTPHLHFAVFELTPERHWWQGTPIDPYLLFSRPAAAR